MSVRSGQASDLDNEAAWLERVVTRLGAVERAAHVHPDFGFPGGIPSEEDIALIAEIIAGEVLAADGPALIIATGDPRWVNVAGDTMTGLLRGVGAYHTGQVRVLGAPQAIIAAGTGGNGYIGVYPNATDVDTLGTRMGYVGGVSNLMRLYTEGAVDLLLGTNGTERYRLTSAGVHQWNSNLMVLDAAGLEVLSSDASFKAARAGNAPFVAFYDTTFGTRYGYIQNHATAAIWNNQVAAVTAFYTSGTETFRANGSDVLVGKTSGGLGTAGVNLFGTGHIYSVVVHNTATGNIYVDRSSSAVATGRPYIVFIENGSGVGSITRGGANLTNYNTSSDRDLKGNVETLDGAEALARVERWRPVSFQWLVDDDGLPSIDGAPAGERFHGFIAQEMAEELPQAVTMPEGTPDDHRAWLVERERYQAAQAVYDQAEHDRGLVELANAAALEQWETECQRLVTEWADAVASWERATTTETDSGIVVVTDRGDPPAQPDLPERPEPIPVPDIGEPPVDPGPSPWRPAGGDWSNNVPDLAAAVQYLAQRDRAKDERIAELEERIARLERAGA